MLHGESVAPLFLLVLLGLGTSCGSNTDAGLSRSRSSEKPETEADAGGGDDDGTGSAPSDDDGSQTEPEVQPDAAVGGAAADDDGGASTPDETASPSAGMQSEPAPEVPAPEGSVTEAPPSAPSSDAGVASQPEEEPITDIWYYVDTENWKVINNILGTDQDVPVSTGVDVQNDVYPWSPDGHELAQVVNEEVVFYDLGYRAEISAQYPAQGYDSVWAWISGFGPVLHGQRNGEPALGAMSPDGTEVVLAQGSVATAIHNLRVAPDGSEVAWSGSDGEGYDFWHCSFAGGVPGEPEVLTQYTGSPVLTARWSSNSAWLAFGLGSASEEGGIYLWRSSLTSPVQVSPPGAGYSPNFSFSPDGSRFVMHSPGEAQSSLLVGEAGQQELSALQTLGQGIDVSPAEWSDYGSYVTYEQGGEGFLQQVGPGGIPEAKIPFPGHGFGCRLAWLSETEFFYDSCAGSGALTLGAIADGTLTTTDLADDSLGNVTLSPGRACLMDWDASVIRVGPATADGFAQYLVPTLGGELSFVSFTPDGGDIVWTEDGTAQYRVKLIDCVPVGDVKNIRGAAYPVDRAVFVTPARQ